MALAMTFGRKFWAGLFALVLLILIYILTLAIAKDAITSTVMVAWGGFIITVCFMYIGGNVWKAWIKSKYFRAELANGQNQNMGG